MGERLTQLERFMANVSKTETCWIWTGTLDRHGYGRLHSRQMWAAHRFAYMTFVGPIPAGLQLDHLCRNPPCVNPDHLEAVTPRENSLRSRSFAAENARKTHCAQGHPFDAENTYVRQGDKHGRQCRACNRAAVARYAARRKRTT